MSVCTSLLGSEQCGRMKKGDICRASVFVTLFAGSSQLEYSLGTEGGFRAMIPNLGATMDLVFFSHMSNTSRKNFYL